MNVQPVNLHNIFFRHKARHDKKKNPEIFMKFNVITTVCLKRLSTKEWMSSENCFIFIILPQEELV